MTRHKVKWFLLGLLLPSLWSGQPALGDETQLNEFFALGYGPGRDPGGEHKDSRNYQTCHRLRHGKAVRLCSSRDLCQTSGLDKCLIAVPADSKLIKKSAIGELRLKGLHTRNPG